MEFTVICKMKRIYLILALIVAVVVGFGESYAQNKSERDQWLEQIRQYKRTYFTKELDLTKEQQQKFFPLYEEMENQTSKLEEDARIMERRVSEATDATDIEYEKAAEVLYDMKLKQAEVEKSYMEKFKAILSARQLFELKGVERKFSRDMMRQHNRIRSSRRVEAK